MNYYIVTMINRGKKEDIGLYASDRKHANELAKLKFSGVLIKIVEGEEPFEDKLKKFKASLFSNMKKKKLKQDALIAAMRQLAVMVNAGISIYDSLVEIAKATTDAHLKHIFTKLAEDVNSGQSFSKSMENFRYEVGNLTIAMLKLGEKTGNLDDALYSLADMLEEIRANIIKFKKAMAYPRNVMIAMAAAFTILISYVVPNFKSMFEKLGAELPLPTLILLKLEHIFNNYGLYVLAGLVLFFISFRYIINTNQNARYAWHQALLKVYLIKNIIMNATLSRFTLVFSELVRAGIPIAEALDTSISMIDNMVLKHKLSSVRGSVEKGMSLSEGLEDTKLFENMILQMINAGEESGTLDAMIKKVAEYYKMRFDAIIDNLSDSIEPIMLAILAAMILLLALGIFLPMWDMGNVVMGG
ncbi:MAG: type II secretion system F family protein [Sulfurimonadaceae bacterium]|nr:type II secretion system F family protein [Sulfurimonadaceae bacterium]